MATRAKPEDVAPMDDELDDLAADEEVLDMAEPDMPGDELAEQEEELEEDQGYKDEYRRRIKGPGGVEQSWRGTRRSFQQIYEGKYGGGKGEKSATHPGEEDYTTKKGMKKKTGPAKHISNKKNPSVWARD